MKAFVPFENDLTGIPDGWPQTQPREIESINDAHPGELVLLDADFAEHMASVTPLKDAWNATHKDRGPGKVWSRTEFKALFTDEEWAFFKSLVKSENPIAGAIWEDLLLVTTIEQRNPKTTQALGALAAIGVISQDRIAEILA